MKAVISVFVLLGVRAVLGAARQATRPSGEGRISALESAWDPAEQNKDATADITGEQIKNEGVTVHLYGNNVAVSTGIYRDKGMEKGRPFSRRGRFTNVWLNQNGKWECISSQSTLIAHQEWEWLRRRRGLGRKKAGRV